MPNLRDNLKVQELLAGGPGSGRVAVFGLTDKATGNKVHDALKSLGYTKDVTQHQNFYTHPDGHEAIHTNPNFMVNKLRIVSHGGSVGDAEDHFADVEQRLQKH